MSLSHSNFWEQLDSEMQGPLLKMKPNLSLRLSRKYICNAFRSIDLIIYLLHFHTPKYLCKLSPCTPLNLIIYHCDNNWLQYFVHTNYKAPLKSK